MGIRGGYLNGKSSPTGDPHWDKRPPYDVRDFLDEISRSTHLPEDKLRDLVSRFSRGYEAHIQGRLMEAIRIYNVIESEFSGGLRVLQKNRDHAERGLQELRSGYIENVK